MIYAEPEHARGRSFAGLLAYVLHDVSHAATSERVLFVQTLNLVFGIAGAADEVEGTIAMALSSSRKGRKPDRLAFHFILSWHRDDRPAAAHMAATAASALAALGLGEHQAVIVGHDDTNEPHVHVAVNVLHPDTGIAARLGWRHRTMSRWAAAYERDQGVIRCHRRGMPKVANENRKRLGRKEWERQNRKEKNQKPMITPTPRP